MKTQTLKGFRDFLPAEARKRQYVVDVLRKTFEFFDFEPLETPALEYEEVLLGKYGEEGDRLMYRFTDNGKRKVALRYDQTVPTARVVAQYQNGLPMPFMRYQIQPVWRAENTQKGRFREFIQCDADIIGSSSPLADAQIIMVAMITLNVLGFEKFKVLINDRKIFQEIPKEAIVAIDKLKKIGKEAVVKELTIKLNIALQKAEEILLKVQNAEKTDLLKDIENVLPSIRPNDRILEVSKVLKTFDMKNIEVNFSPTLARGLDYYTGLIFEIEVDGYTAGSVCGGGRYDNLIGMFAGKQIPAVGFAFGFDRIMEALEQFNLIPKIVSPTQVLVTIFSPELKNKSLETASKIRSGNINVQLYLDEAAKMEKQLKYADTKGIPYVVIIGPDEAKNNTVTIRNMKTRDQKTISLDNLPDELI